MENPFSPKNAPVNRPKRNVFDLSHTNNLTMGIGKLYPVLCLPVLPGDSFKIDGAAQLKAVPLQFPIQTRITLSLHYFYVRNRNLWEHWQDYIGHSEVEYTHPWLKNPSANTIGTRQLGDYLGVPTTIGNVANVYEDIVPPESPLEKNSDKYPNLGYLHGKTSTNFVGVTMRSLFGGISAPYDYVVERDGYDYYVSPSSAVPFKTPVHKPVENKFELLGSFVLPAEGQTDADYFLLVSHSPLRNNPYESTHVFAQYPLIVDVVNSTSSKSIFSLSSDNFETLVNNPIWDSKGTVYFTFGRAAGSSNYGFRNGTYISASPLVFNSNYKVTLRYKFSQNMVTEASSTPFSGSSPKIPLNVLPFRAYEQIYNFFYRNEMVDPYVLDGKIEFNKFSITSDGADETDYKLHNRNWEIDFLTGCVKSPQAGEAPLVGVVSNTDGTATFHFSKIHETDDTTNLGEGYMDVETTVAEDGRITGISNYDENIPSANLRRLANYISQGISINDFRNVNAFQRFLENCQRKGFRYREQLLSHFGIAPDYPDVDVPEFLGGYTVELDANQISQTIENDVAPLGSYAGQLNGRGVQQNSISHYFPEHGYVMCIASIIPAASYSQVLPLDLTKVNSKLEHYFPEFGKIGYVPVDYRQICPVETYNKDVIDGTDTLLDTFGYQRAWYEYMSVPDSIHGDLRLSLRDFLVNRVFSAKPELSKEFIEIREEDVNNIFANISEDTDKFFGNIFFKISAQRPIPRFANPSIE